ncbi:MAG: ABC transporter permease [Lachnospiraceae bacterium]
MNKREKNQDIRLWAVLIWLLVWQLVSMALNSDILLVSPVKVVLRLFELMGESGFWKSIAYSLIRIAGGFFSALLAGGLFAALSSRFRPVRQLLAPLILFSKTVPVASFIILALVWLSSRNLSIFISFLMVFPVIYTNVLNGIMETDRELLEMAEVFSIPQGRRIRYIYLPQLMPYLRAGCSVGLGLCWKSGIAAEVIGMPKGSIGERLQQAKVYLDTADLLAWTLVIVVVSLLFERWVLWLLDRADRVWERR